MLDKMIWMVFEKTGNIDAYLLYIDIKNIKGLKEIDIRTEAEVNSTSFNW